ncbi:MAG: hypothetical protein JF571_06645 [Asticcacaulis sp.]|nr:hypothetical protein [Asticcacaulis sp.]
MSGKSLRSGMASRIVGPWDWIILPAILAVAATVVLGTPFQPFGLQLPEPVWPLVLAFAWPLIRPSYFAPIVLGLLGLFLDFYWSVPAGFYTLNLMLIYGVLILARAYVAGQDWRVVFGAWLGVQLAFFGIGVLFTALDTGFVVRLWGVFEQMVATAALFPIVLFMLEKFVNADVRFQ